MSDQLEPELERVARMLADAGPLPGCPGDAARARAGHPRRRAGGRRRRRPRRGRAPPPAAQAARHRPRSASRPPSRRSRSCRPCSSTRGGDVGQQHRARSRRSFAPKGGGTAHVVTHGDGSATIELQVWKLPRPGTGQRLRGLARAQTATARPLGHVPHRPRRQGHRQLHACRAASWAATAGSG